MGQIVANTNISQRALKGIHIIFPSSLKEQEDIYHSIQSLDRVINEKLAKIETLKKLKKSLMQNLLTGKIRVNLSQFQQEISRFS
jgi:type I restriction enzyme S subunit